MFAKSTHEKKDGRKAKSHGGKKGVVRPSNTLILELGKKKGKKEMCRNFAVFYFPLLQLKGGGNSIIRFKGMTHLYGVDLWKGSGKVKKEKLKKTRIKKPTPRRTKKWRGERTKRLKLPTTWRIKIKRAREPIKIPSPYGLPPMITKTLKGNLGAKKKQLIKKGLFSHLVTHFPTSKCKGT